MKITVLCVGKVKEEFYRGAIREFEKRLSRYTRLEIVEVADEKTPESASPAQEAQILEKEGKRLLARIPEDACVTALAIRGRAMSSEEMAEHIGSLTVSGTSHLVYVIGGSLGLSPEVLARANEQLSFSRMTFPHQLMRVILLEQIYRSFRILNREPYHK